MFAESRRIEWHMPAYQIKTIHMKILIVSDYDSVKNPFLNSLVDGLINCGNDVVCGLELFWNAFNNFDLIYFQWPELIFQWNTMLIDIEKLSKHLDRIQEMHIKMLITCHNLHPHNNDSKTKELYNLVYSKVDAFHHLGNNSFQLLKKKYPSKYHFIAPHHIADSLLDNKIDSSEAKARLNIPNDNIVISSFGVFRDNKEFLLFVYMVISVYKKDLTFLAPRICLIESHCFNRLLYLCRCFICKLFGIRYSGFLAEDEMKLWLSASDIVFIQRYDILNSGNIPLAFSAGKVVVGPSCGNVGEIIEETGNYLFDPHNWVSIKKAMLNALGPCKKSTQLGEHNYQYAIEHWSTTKVCELIDSNIRYIKQT